MKRFFNRNKKSPKDEEKKATYTNTIAPIALIPTSTVVNNEDINDSKQNDNVSENNGMVAVNEKQDSAKKTLSPKSSLPSSLVPPSLQAWNSKSLWIYRPTLKFESDYDMLKLISENGAFGVVYRCKLKRPLAFDSNDNSNNTYAVKIIDKKKIFKIPSASKRDKYINNIKNELKILKTLQTHPNVVHLKSTRDNIYEDENNVYIIMEELVHSDLFEYIIKHEKLNESQCFHIMYQLFSAICDLHEKYFIVHCDLKPANILISYNEAKDPFKKFPIVKIIDFGMSYILKPFRYLDHLCGSPYYTAPEIFTLKRFNHAVDIWSLGVIMYISLFGYFPFFVNPSLYDDPKKHIEAIYCKIRQGFQPNVISTEKYGYGPWFPDHIPVSSEARDLISKLLTSDPNLRITSFEVLNHPWIKKFQAQQEYSIDKILNIDSSSSSLTLSETNSIGFVLANESEIDENYLANKQHV